LSDLTQSHTQEEKNLSEEENTTWGTWESRRMEACHLWPPLLIDFPCWVLMYPEKQCDQTPDKNVLKTHTRTHTEKEHKVKPRI